MPSDAMVAMEASSTAPTSGSANTMGIALAYAMEEADNASLKLAPVHTNAVSDHSPPVSSAACFITSLAVS